MRARDLVVVCGKIASGKSRACADAIKETDYQVLQLDRLAVHLRLHNDEFRNEFRTWCIAIGLEHRDRAPDVDRFLFSNILFNQFAQDSGFRFFRAYLDIQRPYLQYHLDQLIAETPALIIEVAVPPIMTGLKLPPHRGFIVDAGLNAEERVALVQARGSAMTAPFIRGMLRYQEQLFAGYNGVLCGLRGYETFTSYDGKDWVPGDIWASRFQLHGNHL
jgi:hypothetical protein